MITVSNNKEAWSLITKLNGFNDVAYDEESSIRAGYKVYRTTDFNYYICDLNTRLEVNTPEGSYNIYIEEANTKLEKFDNDCTVNLTKKEAEHIPYILNAYKAIRSKNGTLSKGLREVLDNVSRKVFYAYLDKYENKL